MSVQRLLLRQRKVLVILVQTGLVVASYIASFALRLDLDLGSIDWDLVLKTLPLLLAARIGALLLFRLHHGLWRYVGTVELLQIIKATTVSSVAFAALEVLIFGLEGFPRSVFLLDWAGNIFLLSGVRLFVRVVRERFLPMRTAGRGGGALKRLLIIGAGDAGAILCKQVIGSPSFRLNPVAFVDDDASKTGDSIQGVPIVGRCQDIDRVAVEHRIDLAVIAVPSATPAQRRAMVEHCQRAKVDVKVLPATPEIIAGTVSISHIREVDPVDLLGRPPARLDREAVASLIHDRRVLVTGAAGSVGSELARQIGRLQPQLLLLVDQAENPLFFLEAELRSAFPALALEAHVSDITNRVRMASLMSHYRPEVVLHAAAYKHVPLMERSPAEAFQNNVGGTYAVAVCAQEAGVGTFVLVSTDKAVKPISVMGTTKRLAEMLVQEMNHHGSTRFVSVRFGNVLGSNASVVPIFKQQIAGGGPVTVTHPDATRYFMSISEAAALILQAAAVGTKGETYVLDMGDPVRIVTLAETMITLSGMKPYEDIDIVFIGLRPGEKLAEELHADDEELQPTGHEKLLVLKNSHAGTGLRTQIEQLLQDIPSLSPEAVKAHLERLVPGYRPGGPVSSPLSTRTTAPEQP